MVFARMESALSAPESDWSTSDEGSRNQAEAIMWALASYGSLGHPEVCRRACINFLTGQCKEGGACAYCHMPHQGASKPGRRLRALLQSLPRSQLCAIVLPHCQAKLEKAGLMDIGTDVLELLQEGCQDVAPLKEVAWSTPGELANLDRFLTKMKLSNLIGLVTRAADEPDPLFEAVEQLRMELLHSLAGNVLISV
ncbi:unnamed protein product [Symbiodinium pilosum]|uniref:C3H1-type domain-containing protein n=1 Tax=Symbiodinium pilosum TaxID=2952 RepID=A0A812IYC4_SYMPI|nr:unnamed protein product [Symbiodinium pilosum]